ncbi:hypothetical protein Scep_028398 [Stephania cephalantha]|uniref:N-acetyltransferase domain-containing protein n=1 Tax=Stephania cephalantha TaxID=152367 RepID=A0AAP0E9W0_9MAGN
MASVEIVELTRNSRKHYEMVVGAMVRIEKKLFPKHESLAKSFEEELSKKNCGLLYLKINGDDNDDDDVGGYVMYSWPSSLLASITKLAVKERYQRQGHGEALLRAAIQKCRTRNIQRVRLHVDPSRAAALSLYLKLGFQIDELIEHYYSSDRNAYRMYLDFNDN